LLSGQPGIGVRLTPLSLEPPQLKKTNLQRTKIEPKTFFANERTFIQWLSAAILLVTLSTAIMTFNESQSRAAALAVQSRPERVGA
jgi:uncharacterized membrane protein YidH (DUF202 family)